MFKNLFILIASFSLALVTGCFGGSGGGGKIPSKVVLNNPKALFLSGDSAAGGARRSALKRSEAGGSELADLYQVLADNSFQKVTFTDEDGNETPIQVFQMLHLSDQYIALDIDVGTGESGYTAYLICDVTSGKIYNFTDYAIFAGAMGESYFSVPAFFNGSFYVMSADEGMPNGTLYRVNLATMQAEPMNNPNFLHIIRFYHISDGNFLVYENTAMRIYLLRSDGSAPVEITGADYDAVDEMNDLSGGNKDVVELIYDKNFNLCDFDVTFESLPGNDNIDVTYLTFSVDAGGFNVNSTPVVSDLAASYSNHLVMTSNNLYDTSRVLILETGYVTINQNSVSGFDSNFTAKDLSFFFPDTGTIENLIWDGATAFYTSGSNIMKWDVASSATAGSVFLSASVIANSMKVIGGYLYYASYVNATDVQTLKIKTDGSEATPTVVASSNMEIRDIVEFTVE